MHQKIHNRPFYKAVRKHLRNNATHEEQLLWQKLKGRQLGDRKFRRQHGIDIWVVDFYCPEEKLVIELDGNQHNTEQGRFTDEHRDSSLFEYLNIKVIRFTNVQVRNNIQSVLEEIQHHFTNSPTQSR